MDDVVAELPNDVLVDIFVRLPARHIARCRAVCRAWRSVISSPTFDRCHAERRPAAVAEVIAHDDLRYYQTVNGELLPYAVTRSIVFSGFSGSCWQREDRRRRWMRPPRTLWLPSPLSLCTFFLGSWDGVACIEWGYRWPQMGNQFQVVKYVLWNPITMACATINPPEERGDVIGGYAHPETRRFHLLHASGDGDNWDEHRFFPTRFRIQRAGDSVWRELHDHVRGEDGSSATGTEPPPGFCMEARRPRFVGLHGNLHWLVKSSASGSVTLQMLVFDTTRETLWRMETPERRESPEHLEMARIGVLSGGRLCIFAVDPLTATMAMWVLDNYSGRPGGSCWGIKERISLVAPDMKDLSRTFSTVAEVEVVEGVREGEEVFLRQKDGRIDAYNLRRKAWNIVRGLICTPVTDKEWLGMHRESILEGKVCFGEASRAVSRWADHRGQRRYYLQYVFG